MQNKRFDVSKLFVNIIQFWSNSSNDTFSIRALFIDLIQSKTKRNIEIVFRYSIVNSLQIFVLFLKQNISLNSRTNQLRPILCNELSSEFNFEYSNNCVFN